MGRRCKDKPIDIAAKKFSNLYRRNGLTVGVGSKTLYAYGETSKVIANLPRQFEGYDVESRVWGKIQPIGA